MNKHTLEDKTIIANQYIEEEHYWLTKLSRSPEKTVLPYGILEKGTGKSQKSEYHYKIQGQTFEKLMKLSKKTDAKLHMILVTGMVVLLNKLTDNEDILIGTTILRQETEANFLNTVLVLRNQVNQEMSLKELLMGVRKDLIKAIENQNYPVEALPYRLNHPDKDGEGFPLFDIALILKNFHDKEYLKNIQFNMLFEFDRQQNYIELSLEYSTQYYEKDQIEIYINCFEHILNELPERIDHQISKIEILKQEDREGLVNTLNQSSEETLRSMNKTLHQLFGEQVEKTPANIAIIENQGNQAARSITYQELNKDADQKAGYLQIQGVQRNCIVALEMQENIEMISRILGILKAGGAYLPIDPQYPEQRKQYILKDSAVKWVLRDEKIGTGKLNNSQVISEPHSLAYVIYTSGTTGKPKGVLVEHAGVVSMLTSRKAEYQMDENIVSLQLFSYAFDGFVTSFFTTLISGGQAILMGPQQKGDVNRIREEIKNHRISHMICIPTLYRMLMTSLQPGEGQSLKVITLAGEKVSLQEVESTKEKLPQTELVVEYGVTEGTVLSTINRHQETSKRITIGKAIPNNQVYILGKGKQLQPMGIPGELHISGAGVARGYMNQNELTQHRFIDNPFKGKEGQQVYCTGDLARILPDGNFEFLGRKDRQVKIRGYRIELGEIESAMIIHPGVRNAVAIDREDSNGERELVAYVVPDPKRSFPICKILELKNKGQLFHKSPFELPGDIPVFGFNEQEIRYIYEHITKEYEEIQLEEGACVFDIGAHIGLFSIYLHQKVKKPQIWAFEPIPEIFDCLEFNNRILGMNMNLNKYAVGKINENRSFTYYPRNTAGSSCYADTEEDAEHMKAFLTYKRTEQQEEGTENEKLDEFISERMQGQAIDCPIKTISQVIKENNLKKIDLIKIVAEKSELDILKGIQEQDWGKIQQLAIEVHEEGDSLESILKLLKNNGYQVKIRQSEIQKKMGACNLIAQRQPQESTSSLGNQEKKTKLEWQWATAGKLKKDLKKRLLSRLPDYMVPSHIVLMPSLPLTVHGKLDLKALPSPEILQQDYEGPGNITEKKLAGIWAKILNLKEEEISIHSNFFEIGGHSIKASNLAIQVEKEFGVGIPLLEVFKTPTIKGLSEYVLTKKRKLPSITSTGHQNLVLLKKSEINDKQLFFIHDGTGDIEGYVELVRELGSVGSCWGIKVMHPEQLAPYNTTFEEVAARYIELIKEVQEKGAYHIMGWSLGGILAYEMAYQLENQGKKIGFLGMIDTYKFTGKAQKEQEGFTLEGEKAFITEVLNQEDIPGWLKKITKIDKIWETIAKYFENIADGEAQLNLWVERMYIHEVIPGIKQMEIRKKIFYLNVFRSLFRAHISYLNSPLKQLKTTIHYFKAKDNVGVETQIPFVDRGGETQKFLELEGDHYSLLKAPAVIKLAQEIRKYNEAK